MPLRAESLLPQPNLFSPQSPNGSPHEPAEGSPNDSAKNRTPASIRNPIESLEGLDTSGGGSDFRNVAPTRGTIWLRRVELIVRVVVRLYLGLIVFGLPWTRLWDENHLLSLYPRIADLATTGIARGLVSGLGLLNIWIAASDAIHYRESDAPRS